MTIAEALSKQLKDKMIDDDKKKLEADEANKKILEELENLRKEKAVSEYTAKYLAQGYDEALAKETAEALQAGNMEKVFANGEKHKEAMEKAIKEKLMKNDPPPGGAGDDDKDKDVAVAKAKELAKAKLGNDKTYNDIMSKYKK